MVLVRIPMQSRKEVTTCEEEEESHNMCRAVVGASILGGGSSSRAFWPRHLEYPIGTGFCQWLSKVMRAREVEVAVVASSPYPGFTSFAPQITWRVSPAGLDKWKVARRLAQASLA